MTTPGRQLTEEEAQAPIGHLEGRFTTLVPMDQAAALRNSMRDVGVNWFQHPPEPDGTVWFTLRGPSSIVTVVHEHYCGLSGVEPNSEVVFFDSTDGGRVVAVEDGARVVAVGDATLIIVPSSGE